MYNQLIHIKEHEAHGLPEQDLIQLIKEEQKLVDSIDLKSKTFSAGFFIGASWIANRNKALLVTPKLDSDVEKVDFFSMLSACLEHPEVLRAIDDLFHIDFRQPYIRIKQHQDLITPLLLVHFIHVTQLLVRKGVRKDYYRTSKVLHSRVKGKVLVSDSIRQSQGRANILDTVCSFEEFGLNTPHNKVIKKALFFAMRYFLTTRQYEEELTPILRYILPAFEKVDEEISLKEVQAVKPNPFFTEHSRAVELALIILKRFGFNINSVQKTEEVDVPPFWIDMTRLFEMYVLGKLKKTCGAKNIEFQARAKYGEIDFLRTEPGKEMVIDAKYKRCYTNDKYDIADIRQLAGYARDVGTLKKTRIPHREWGQTVLDCLIVYPDQQAPNEFEKGSLFSKPISQFEKFHKIGISIPITSP